VAVVQYTFTHKQYMEQHNLLIRKSAGRAPSLRDIPWQLPYNLGKKHRKPSVKVVGECQFAKSIQNRAYLSIRIISRLVQIVKRIFDTPCFPQQFFTRRRKTLFFLVLLMLLFFITPLSSWMESCRPYRV